MLNLSSTPPPRTPSPIVEFPLSSVRSSKRFDGFVKTCAILDLLPHTIQFCFSVLNPFPPILGELSTLIDGPVW